MGDNNCEGKFEMVGAEHGFHGEHLESDSEKGINTQWAEGG